MSVCRATDSVAPGVDWSDALGAIARDQSDRAVDQIAEAVGQLVRPRGEQIVAEVRIARARDVAEKHARERVKGASGSFSLAFVARVFLSRTCATRRWHSSRATPTRPYRST